MKELLILSGKGGTGKTSITAAFAHLASHPRVIADCDVDASDLHLVLAPTEREEHPFISGVKARVVPDLCSGCGTCVELCQFDAMSLEEGARQDAGAVARCDELSCEGCGVCARFCPESAIELDPSDCGKWFISKTRFGPMVHAWIRPGEENSGKLVALVKRKASELAEELDKQLILVDGPPGIGCPVIASISGAHLVLVVTEPTQSGRHDLERVIGLTRHFKVPACVCINKWDLNQDMAREIEDYCRDQGIEVVGSIPFDRAVTEAQVQGVCLTEHADSEAARAVKGLWERIDALLF